MTICSPITSYGRIMSVSSCSRMWQWKTYFCVPVTPLGRSKGERILDTTLGFAETVSSKRRPSIFDSFPEAKAKTSLTPPPGSEGVCSRLRYWLCPSLLSAHQNGAGFKASTLCEDRCPFPSRTLYQLGEAL